MFQVIQLCLQNSIKMINKKSFKVKFIKLKREKMRQKITPQNKLITFLKSTRHQITLNGSIDVDTVKIHEVIEVNPLLKTIGLQPISLQKQIVVQQQNYSWGTRPTKDTQFSKKLINNQNWSMKLKKYSNQQTHRKRQKLKPQIQFYTRVQEFVKHFVNINETKQRSRITSQQFYNLIQTRKNLPLLLAQKNSLVKFLFEISYTNYLSFLQFVIQTKQERYQIYYQFQQIQKITELIRKQVADIEELYLSEQMGKIEHLYPDELIRQIQNLQNKFVQLYGQQQVSTQIFEQPIQLQNQLNMLVQEQVIVAQGGQLNLSSAENLTFQVQIKKSQEKLAEDNCSRSLVSREEFHLTAEKVQAEQDVKGQIQNISALLISSFQERLIYSQSQSQSPKQPSQQKPNVQQVTIPQNIQTPKE